MDEYWQTQQATMAQLQGMLLGLKQGCGLPRVSDKIDETTKNVWATLEHPTLEHLLLINAWGDLYQITVKFAEPGKDSKLYGRDKGTLLEHCSAIVKLLPDNKDVVFAHNTWDSYAGMGPRIFKQYTFPILRHGFAEMHYSTYFSSSPGLLSSVDDFFVVSGFANLGVIETTNSLFINTANYQAAKSGVESLTLLVRHVAKIVRIRVFYMALVKFCSIDNKTR